MAHVALALPTLAPRGAIGAGEAVEAIIGYAQAARRAVLAAQEHAARWTDSRACGHGATLIVEPADAWRGNRPGYRVPDALG